MCHPAALAIAAGVVSAAGSIVGGMQTNAQYKYQARIDKQNAKLAAEQAHESVLQGRDEAQALFRNAGQIEGQQAASMAANGVDLSFGSAALVQEDTKSQEHEDASALYRNVYNRTRGFDIDASNYQSASKAAKQQGKAALIGGFFDAAGSLMSGFSQASGMKAKTALGRTGG